MSSLTNHMPTFLPRDRRSALATNTPLPERAAGTALFADVSGFTPLTEALAKSLGAQHGAEALTAILNDIFTALISQVHQYGGSVVGFGGDAITCWFPETTVTPRTALACAAAMMREMTRFAEVSAPDGQTYALSMKIGVAHGPVRRFLAGAPEYGYLEVLAGATMDRMAAAEHHATTGEIVCAGDLYELIGEAANWGEDRGRFRLCLSMRNKIAPNVLGRSSIPRIPLWAVQDYLPPAIFHSLRGAPGGFLAELRPVVSAFVRFAGLAYDADTQVGNKLSTYVTMVQHLTTQYGGSVIRLDCGDKGSVLHVLFGAPVAHEDDEIRAVGWALALQSAVAELPFITAQYIGMTRGSVYAGAVGAPTRRVYTVMGDEVNVSARLMQACQSGQTLVSQRIMHAAQGKFMFQRLPGFRVKGKNHPIPVAVPLAKLPPTVHTPPISPLVGRDSELVYLEEILAEVLSGAGRVLRILGNAGVGKSRLVAELVQRAMIQGVRTIVGNCHSTGRSISYLPWREIAQQLFGLQNGWPVAQQMGQIESMLRWMNPNWLPRLPLLGDLLDIDIPDNPTTAALSTQLRQQSLFALISELLTHLANSQPLLIVIEDEYWIDEASAALLEALGHSLATERVLLALTQRPGDDTITALNTLSHYRQVDLVGLTSEAVRDIIMGRLGGDLPSDTFTFIQERAQGNPFFVEELADALRDTSYLELVDGRWVLASEANTTPQLPDTIQGLVLARIDCVDERSKLTLKVSSVPGRTFERDLVVQVHPARPTTELLDTQLNILEKRGFILQDKHIPLLTYTFKHNITHEVAYQTLLFTQRSQLHRAVGEALEKLSPDAVEQLAYHYSRSAVRDKAAHYLGLAADKARREYANETALDYYNKALVLETRKEWLLGKVEILHLLGQREEEAATLQSLADMPNVVAAKVNYLWARHYEVISNYEKAKETGECARSAYQQNGNQLGEARCLTLLGLIARKQGDYPQAIEYYEKALTLLRAQQQVEEIPTALNGLGMVYMNLGKYAEAQECQEQALEIQRVTEDLVGQADSLNYLGAIARERGDLDSCLAHHQQALALRQVIGDRWGEGGSLFNLGLHTYDLGDYAQAESYYTQALDVQRAIGDRWGEANTLNGYGVLCQDTGDLTKAQNLLKQALELSRSIGDSEGECFILLNLGAISRELSNFEQSAHLLTDAITLARNLKHRWLEGYILNYMGLLYIASGATTKARDCAAMALDIRRELKQHSLQADDFAILAKAHLALGEQKEALHCAHKTLDILDRCNGEGTDAPQRDYFFCYQVLMTTEHVPEARKALQAAYDLVMTRAQKIKDPASRRSFLEDVTQNREIIIAWETQQVT